MRARRRAVFGAVVGCAFLLFGMLLQAACDDGDGGVLSRIGRTLAMPITWLVAMAPSVVGMLVGAREDRSAQESEDRHLRDRKERAATALHAEKAARGLHAGAQALASSIASLSGATRRAADDIRGSASPMRQLGENAARARQNAEKFMGLADFSRERSREGLLEIDQSADDLLKLAEEVRGLATGIEGLNERMRSIVGMASAMNQLGEKFESLADSAAEEMAEAPSEFPLGLHFIVSEMRRQGKDARNGATLVQGIVAELQRAMATTVTTAEDGVSRAERGARVASRIGKSIKQIAEALEASAAAAAEMVTIAAQQHEGMGVMGGAMDRAYRAIEEANGSTLQAAREAKDLSFLASELRGSIQQGQEGRPLGASHALAQLTGEAS